MEHTIYYLLVGLTNDETYNLLFINYFDGTMEHIV